MKTKPKRKEKKRKGLISVRFANLPSRCFEANFNINKPFPTTRSLSKLFLHHPAHSLKVSKQYSVKLCIAD